MRIFETFNFDIIILLVLIAMASSSLYFGLYRQTRKTLTLIGPIIVLYFLFNKIMKLVNNSSFGFKISTGLSKLLKINIYQSMTYTMIIYIICWLILGFIIRFLYGIYRMPIEKKVLTKPSWISKVISLILGIINAYVIIMILMFALKPLITIDYEKPITKVFVKTSNDVVTVSNLNKFQNVNIQEYLEYQESIDYFTGYKVANHYQNIVDFLESLPNINETLKNNFPNLSTASQEIITKDLIDDNYLQAFMSGEKTINFKVVLKNEKTNPIYSELDALYNILLSNKGYLFVYHKYLNNQLENYDYPTLTKIILDNQEEILNQFVQTKSKDQFLGVVADFSFQVTYRDEFFQILGIEDTITIKDQVQASEEMINSERLFSLAANFIEHFQDDNNPIITGIKKTFMKTLNSEKNINNISRQMSLAGKLVFGKDYEYWFVYHTWEKNILIKTYLMETISFQEANGYRLYSEYFFYEYLVSDFTFEEPIDIDDFNIILFRLNQIVVDDILKEPAAIRYLENLFIDNRSVLGCLIKKGLVSPSLFSDLLTIENQYLSERIIEVLSSNK